MKKFLNYVFAGVSSLFGLLALSAPASAAGLSDLTSGIDFSEVSTAVIAVGVALAGVYVLWKGASLILRAIRGL
jgi:hypothetical protein